MQMCLVGLNDAFLALPCSGRPRPAVSLTWCLVFISFGDYAACDAVTAVLFLVPRALLRCCCIHTAGFLSHPAEHVAVWGSVSEMLHALPAAGCFVQLGSMLPDTALLSPASSACMLQDCVSLNALRSNQCMQLLHVPPGHALVANDRPAKHACRCSLATFFLSRTSHFV